jgi:hypothetical protein
MDKKQQLGLLHLEERIYKGRMVLQKLFEIRDQVHYIHLQTTSFAEHKALNEFYDGILDLADSFIETYQGKYGRVKGKLTTSIESDMEGMDYIKLIRPLFAKDGLIRKSFSPDETHLTNIVDEMLALVDKTIYLLSLK